ncbi:Hypothetical predicted protein [Cloeon dipterum]|uniref:Uncharacterized protein n=1 Tax=Cloeon dipterum TaxID=197152 RepID=A0A8S1DWW7_9INSE|nr:Hypothetical predicted protein [Cloeon dipterum]
MVSSGRKSSPSPKGQVAAPPATLKRPPSGSAAAVWSPGGARRQVLLVPVVAGARVLDLAAILRRDPLIMK